MLSVIHYTIRGAVCFQFTHFSRDGWENIYILCLIIIIKSQVWTITHWQCLGLGHETMVCAVCLYAFLSNYLNQWWHYLLTHICGLLSRWINHWMSVYRSWWHGDVMTKTHFQHYWPLVAGHMSPVQVIYHYWKSLLFLYDVELHGGHSKFYQSFQPI